MKAKGKPKKQEDETPETKDATRPEGEVEGLRPEDLTVDQLRELEDKAARADEHLDQLQHAMADLSNLQRRLHREKDLARKTAVRDLISALVPSFDNLDRALASAQEGAKDPVVEGVRMVNGEIFRILGDHGVRRIDPEGEALDPNLHEAISQMPSPEHQPGTVIAVAERGYAIGDILIRPARVVVATEPPVEDAPDGDS